MSGSGDASPKTKSVKALDVVRNILSTIVTLGSLTLIIYAIGNGYAALPGHPAVLYSLFLFVIVLLAYLEGLQVAILALQHTGSEQMKDAYPRAYSSHKLSKGRNGLNVQRFLVGRQFFVVFVVFLCAQLTTYADMPQGSIPDWLWTLVIETGLPGALVVLAFGQLIPQLVAATHPVALMNLRGTWSVIQLCLTFEAVGVTHFSWVGVAVVKKLCNMSAVETIAGGAGEADVSGVDVEAGVLMATLAQAAEKHSAGVCVLGVLDVSADVVDDSTAKALEQGAAQGMEGVGLSDAATARWLREESTRHRFGEWGVTSSSKRLPAPPEIVQHLVRSGKCVPRYLLPPHHTKHIPPHIVAYEMTKRNESLAALVELQRRTLLAGAEVTPVAAALLASDTAGEQGRPEPATDASEHLVGW